MANTYASLTLPSAHGSVYKWTYSFWVKRSSLGANQCIVAPRYSGTYSAQIRFTNDEQLEIHDYRTSYKLQKITTRKFMDTSSWYHIVIANDNSVSSPDCKIYVNGVEETDFSTDNEYSQNETTSFNNDYPNYIGQKGSGAAYFDGYISHFHFIDGTAYTASTFGSTDSTTGEWKINTNPSVTYGDNGFFLFKDGNSLTDQSPNTNNFTLGGGTITDVKDNPSNVFATWNALIPMHSSMVLANGNTTGTTANAYGNNVSNSFFSTLGMSSGKWYAEFKYVSSSTNDGCYIGVGYDLSKNIQGSGANAYNFCQSIPEGYGYAPQGNVESNGISSGYSTYTIGDIIGVAIDCDNNTLNFYKNNASAGNQISIAANKEYFFAFSDGTGGNTFTMSANFGNGFFGTTAITGNSGNGYAGADGKSKFNYQPPSGYSALSTVGLNL
tara:strand:- start:1712 stop:3031 length:1320 start_codon:yes stop_codon:yes gene_type:complete